MTDLLSTNTLSTDVLAAINGRASATKLGEPGPADDDLRKILTAGIRAPDHGRLRPWRFVVVAGDARARLGDLLAETFRAGNPEAGEAAVAREREKALRSPVIVVVAARVQTGGRIPEIEQVLAVGAGVQNMILAAQALGYGTMWKTGTPAYDEKVKLGLGLEAGDHIVAFLYIGTTVATLGPRPAALDAAVVEF